MILAGVKKRALWCKGCPTCKVTGDCRWCLGTGECHTCKGEGRVFYPNPTPSLPWFKGTEIKLPDGTFSCGDKMLTKRRKDAERILVDMAKFVDFYIVDNYICFRDMDPGPPRLIDYTLAGLFGCAPWVFDNCFFVMRERLGIKIPDWFHFKYPNPFKPQKKRRKLERTTSAP